MLDRALPTAIRLLTGGGDERIAIDPMTGLNRYRCAPAPVADEIAFASCTANRLSRRGYDHVAGIARRIETRGFGAQDYALALESCRRRIAIAYRLDGRCRIVFAPSGTDLEYVALAARTDEDRPIANILLAPEEVGSGCIASAGGRHFAAATALGPVAGDAGAIAGLEDVAVTAVPIRDAAGTPLASARVAAAIALAARRALAAGRQPLAHIVHGSKTGLVVPCMADVDRLRAMFGPRLRFVVDACQARIGADMIRAYLRRGIIVLLSGSKFMGGAPFSGFALVPDGCALAAAPLPAGLDRVFSRAEWPGGWPAVDRLSEQANPGLYLRIASALFELERFMPIPCWRIDRVLGAFDAAVGRLAHLSGARRIAGDFRSLATVDLSAIDAGIDMDAARAIHRAMIDGGVRLGQPVQCMGLASGGHAGTLRLALSMPQVATLNLLSDRDLIHALGEDMDRVRAALADAIGGWRRGSGRG